MALSGDQAAAVEEPEPPGGWATGPWEAAGRPPASALEVRIPSIDRFGWRELLRMVEVAAVLVALVVRRIAVGLVRRRPVVDAAADGLVDAFIALGPTYVKLGQVITSSPGLFPAPLVRACGRCLSAVPPFPAEEARRRVEEDLGAPIERLFRSFDDEPLASGSIAQVHACVMPDGREAVVKVQRPDIAEGTNRDLRINHRLARLIERFERGRRLNPVATVREMHLVANQELNAALEAHRQSLFRDGIGAYGDNAWVTAPEVYWERCGPHTICMERMWGVPVDEFEALRERGVDGELIIRRGMKVAMEAALVHGPFHGDVHAGNIWVLDDGRSAYLDFGLMGDLGDEWRQQLRDIFYSSMIDGDWRRVVRGYKRLGVLSDDSGSDEDIAMMMKVVVEPMLATTSAGVSLGDTFKANVELAEQMGATAPAELMLVAKQVLYFEKYVKELAPDYVMAQDLFLMKNVFPEAVAAKAAETGFVMPE